MLATGRLLDSTRIEAGKKQRHFRSAHLSALMSMLPSGGLNSCSRKDNNNKSGASKGGRPATLATMEQQQPNISARKPGRATIVSRCCSPLWQLPRGRAQSGSREYRAATSCGPSIVDPQVVVVAGCFLCDISWRARRTRTGGRCGTSGACCSCLPGNVFGFWKQNIGATQSAKL